MKVIKIVRILLEVVGAVTVSLFFLIAFPIVQAKIGSPRGVNDDVLPSVFARVGLVAYLVANMGALGGLEGTSTPCCVGNLLIYKVTRPSSNLSLSPPILGLGQRDLLSWR